MNRQEALLKSKREYNECASNKILAEKDTWKNNIQGFKKKNPKTFKKNRERRLSLPHNTTYYKTTMMILLLLLLLAAHIC